MKRILEKGHVKVAFRHRSMQERYRCAPKAQAVTLIRLRGLQQQRQHKQQVCVARDCKECALNHLHPTTHE